MASRSKSSTNRCLECLYIFVGVENAAPLLSTFSFRNLLMLVRETLVASAVRLRGPWVRWHLLSYSKYLSTFATTSFACDLSLFPLHLHEHERKRDLFARHSREQVMNNIEMYFSANRTEYSNYSRRIPFQTEKDGQHMAKSQRTGRRVSWLWLHPLHHLYVWVVTKEREQYQFIAT